MKSTGIVRNIDELGRLVIPKEMRIQMNIEKNVPVEFFVEDDKIIVKKFTDKCFICGGEEDLCNFKDKRICAECRRGLAAI